MAGRGNNDDLDVKTRIADVEKLSSVLKYVE